MVAALSSWHEQHEAAAKALADVAVLPAHVMLESYSVLTRLPAGLAVPAATAAGVLSDRFPEPPLRLTDRAQRAILDTLSAAGIVGGASYDALIALEATAHGETLLTVDARARVTYQRLGASFRVIAG